MLETNPFADGSDASFTRFLFRPYLDFGGADLRAPHHVVGLHFAIRAVLDERDYPHLQASMNPSFRDLLLRSVQPMAGDVKTHDLDGSGPNDGPARRIIGLCSSFAAQDQVTQRRVAWILIKAGFHAPAEALLARVAAPTREPSPEQADLSFALVYARYRQFVDEPQRDYSPAEFATIAEHAPPGIARVDASYQVVVQAVKHRADVEAAEAWQMRHLAAIEQSDPMLSAFQRLFVRSRFHRVGAFIPQIRGQPERLRAEMDEAERLARAIPRSDVIGRVAADEVLFPVLESRTREALALGECGRALSHATELVRLSPSDARAWLLLGEVALENGLREQAIHAYGRARWFAPPGRDIAAFMLAQCLDANGDIEAATGALLDSVAVDPLGISAIDALVDRVEQLDNSLLGQWICARAQALHDLRERPLVRQAWPYKQLPPIATKP